jgi:hypothetical protein
VPIATKRSALCRASQTVSISRGISPNQTT